MIWGGITVSNGSDVQKTVPVSPSKFIAVYVDGRDLDADEYTLSGTDSTTVTLLGSYTKGLSNGEHTVIVSMATTEDFGYILNIGKPVEPVNTTYIIAGAVIGIIVLVGIIAIVVKK